MSARIQVTFPVLNEEALLAGSIYDLDEALPSPSEKVA
jgi:hypothetical protein